MASKNQVTLTLAGDSSKLEQAFASVGESSQRMATSVGESSRRVAEESETGFDRAGEAADGAEGKAQGFSDTLTGVADIGAGTSEIMKGNLFEGFVTVGQGAADLAGGLASFVIPAVKNLTVASLGNAVQMARTTAATVAQRAAMVAGAVATNVMTVAQKALNLAMRMNPIGLVITALTLLVGGIILAYKRSETFRSIVQAAMRGVVTAFRWVVDAGAKVWDFFKTIGPKIGGALKTVAAVITAPFRAAFAAVRSAWNSTIGGKGFDIPGWVPEIGGKSFRIPYFHTGGVVSGGLGAETLAVLKAGEVVSGGRAAGAGGGALVIRGDGEIARTLLRIIAREAQVQGGAKVVFDLA